MELLASLIHYIVDLAEENVLFHDPALQYLENSSLLTDNACGVGVTKRVGFHTFRHTLATLLGSLKVNIKTTQELLRHANSNITLRIYQQAVTEEKRAAQDLAFSALFSGGVQSNPSAPNPGA